MYDEYEIAHKEIGTKRVKNIVQYAEKYETLTGTDADVLVKASLDVQKSFISLWEKTYKKNGKVYFSRHCCPVYPGRNVFRKYGSSGAFNGYSADW